MNKEKFLNFIEKRPRQEINMGKEVATITADNEPLFEIMLQGKFLRLIHNQEILFSRTININCLDRHLQLFFEMAQNWQNLEKPKLITHHNVNCTLGDVI